MKKSILWLAVILWLGTVILAGCNKTSNEEVTYNQDSWKEIISEDCQHFFDGCNSCSKSEDWEAICTKMFCEVYEEPKCTDDEFIDDVEIKLDWNGSSEVYSDEDLQAAVDKIENYLDVKVEFQQISYQWDEESANQLSYCQELNPEVDECVFFKTNFYVPEQDAVMAGALEPNTTLSDYEWYLGRTAGGEWNVLTAGY